MPLVSMLSHLSRGTREGFAVPLFDFFELSGTEDAYAVAEELRAPLIAGVYSAWFDRPLGRALVDCLKVQALHSTSPVSVMLDHGTSREQCLRAIDMGFTDVMYDGSALPVDENISITRSIVERAHACGVGVEAEIGHVGQGSDYQEYAAQGKGFTNPSDVVRFVKETGVDMLAIAIGTAHGAYHGEPKLDFALLAEIRRRVDIPLVLHGGSGLSEQQFRDAITGGISKVNVATDLVQTAGARMKIAAVQEKSSMFSIMEHVHTTMREKCGYYLDLFGASGKA